MKERDDSKPRAQFLQVKKRLGITRQAQEKVWIAEKLKEAVRG